MKEILVLGAGGFIGSNLVKRLKKQGHWVRGVDIKYNEFEKSEADEFIIGDLRDKDVVGKVMFSPKQSTANGGSFDEVYNLAANMGGAAFVFSKEYDSEIIYGSLMINLNVAKIASEYKVGKLFFSSSACAYSERLQEKEGCNYLTEDSSWDGKPDSVYGVEKLSSEQIYDAFRRNNGLNVRIARFHNIFGRNGAIDQLKSKFPAAICRKVIEANNGEEIEIWGSGKQVRSFLHIEDCLDGVQKLMESDVHIPINIGSDYCISIDDLAKLVIKISGKDLKIKHVGSNAIGVNGRSSDNTLCYEKIGWKPQESLKTGMEQLYKWIENEIMQKRKI